MYVYSSIKNASKRNTSFATNTKLAVDNFQIH